LQVGFYWPPSLEMLMGTTRVVISANELEEFLRYMSFPYKTCLKLTFFYCWGIDFVGSLLTSYSNEYILVVVDYISKWVEAAIVKKANSRTMVKFLKRNIFYRFGSPRVLISDGGLQLCNEQVRRVFEHYKVRHKIATPYHS